MGWMGAGIGLGKGWDRSKEGRRGGRKARKWDRFGMGDEMGLNEGMDGTWEDMVEECYEGCVDIGEGMRQKMGSDERWETKWDRMRDEL